MWSRVNCTEMPSHSPVRVRFLPSRSTKGLLGTKGLGTGKERVYSLGTWEARWKVV